MKGILLIACIILALIGITKITIGIVALIKNSRK